MPRFSLFISAHLMFGLVVILNKKISFLHDELVQLRAELNRPYFMPTLTDDLRRVITTPGGKRQLSRKSPKKPGQLSAVTVREAAITLKEALPDIDEAHAAFDELEAACMAAAAAAEVPSSAGTQPITMEDTFDLYDHSLLIHVEHNDFEDDMFNDPVSRLRIALICLNNNLIHYLKPGSTSSSNAHIRA